MLRHYYIKVSALLTTHSVWVVIFIHIAGILGLLSPFQHYFRLLTPFNLILSAWVLWVNHQENQSSLMRFSLMAFLSGFAVEWVGVHTGFIFGSYSYGETLGIKIWGVPIIIGLNWLLVMYCVATLTDSLRVPTAIKVLIASLLAVAIDWLIEPVAMYFDFWNWENGVVPVQNFIGWFLTSVWMQTLYHLTKVKAENRLALPFYFIQLFFFLILNLVIR
ncbi:MAG: carotenoid biosynthesis protein [Cyclobacteriaceae bacterium]|nr:carotenoid biosynthesis protein [Cyclobacteriaceae bacterium]